MKRLTLILLLVGVSVSIFSQNIIYVNSTATGGAQNGENWTDAFTNLQDALSAAFSNTEIWVASGIYTPTTGTDRSASFYLNNGVKLYGGFAGTETQLWQRDPGQFVTILSGEIGDPNSFFDNCYHVVRGKGLSENTVIDGFLITAGYSYGQDLFPYTINGIGAGMLLEGASWIANAQPTIRHCKFENNLASYGGAVGIIWSDPDNNVSEKNLVNPYFDDCAFVGNKSSRQGGAIYKTGNTGIDSFLLTNCIFRDNAATSSEGGGIYFSESSDSKIIVRKCIFERDSAFAGGAIYLPATSAEGYSHLGLRLDSCSFLANFALDGAGFYFDNFLPALDSIQFDFVMKNCLSQDNKVLNGDGAMYLFRLYHNSVLTGLVENCTFLNNITGYYVAQITVASGSSTNMEYTNCRFSGNRSRITNASSFPIQISCGAVVTPAPAILKVSNCLFDHNGGGIMLLSSSNNYVEGTITNCTFYENGYPQFVKSLWDTSGGYFNHYRIENSIIWEPQTNIWNMFYNNDPNMLTMHGFEIDHSLISLPDEGGPPGSFQAFGDHMIFFQDPLFVDSSANDFHLLPCSPAANTGSNDVTEDAGLLTDLDGLPRIRYGVVDMGAYEAQDSCMASQVFLPVTGQSALELWNNPSSDGWLVFNLPVEESGEVAITLFDADGRLAARQEIEMDALSYGLYFPELSAGTYFVVLTTARGKMRSATWIRM